MRAKYTLNDFDLTDTAGLAADKPRFSIAEGTSLPIPPGQKNAYTETDNSSGGQLGTAAYYGVTKIPLRIAVTDWDENGVASSQNLLNNRDLIMSKFFEQDYPILRFYPDAGLEDPVAPNSGAPDYIEANYFEARVTFDTLDWKEYGDARGAISTVLTVPDIYLKSPWRQVRKGQFAGEWQSSMVTLTTASGSKELYSTYQKDSDFVLRYKNWGGDSAGAKYAEIRKGLWTGSTLSGYQVLTELAFLPGPEATEFSYLHKSKAIIAGDVDLSAYGNLADDYSITGDDAYRLAVEEAQSTSSDLPLEWLAKYDNFVGGKGQAQGYLVAINKTSVDTDDIVTFYYRDRLV